MEETVSILKVRCEDCTFARRIGRRYEVKCLVYNVLKLPIYPRICLRYKPRR